MGEMLQKVLPSGHLPCATVAQGANAAHRRPHQLGADAWGLPCIHTTKAPKRASNPAADALGA
ncbi:hypothetical protein DCO45_02160 [Comamonas sp. JNW]|nr:hypothetical protein DCO45_02160 [Comamonas sp. JNW]